MQAEKNDVFETMQPSKALAVMALPTVASQLIILLYNLADTWFIGRTGDPYMIAASSLALTVYLAATALANVFGTGGGSLMARLIGEKKTEDARRVASYGIAAAAISAAAFSLLVLVLLEPLLLFLGASENTLVYAKGNVSFLLSLIRHIALMIPAMLVTRYIWGLTGLIWSQLAADLLNAVIVCFAFRKVDKIVLTEMTEFI